MNQYVSFLIIIALASIFLLFLLFLCNDVQRDNYEYKTWFQCRDGDKASKLFRSVLVDNGLNRVDKNWDVFIPCKSDYSDKNYAKIKVTNQNQIITFTPKNGVLGSKQYIWKMLVDYYGRDMAANIMPPSYRLPMDIKLFKKEYSPHK